MTHKKLNLAHDPWQVIEGDTPPEWAPEILGVGTDWADNLHWQCLIGSELIEGDWGDWLYQLPDGTIGTCTDEMAAKMFCDPQAEEGE